MKTRITQEEAYGFLQTLPEEITEETYQLFHTKSLHLRLTDTDMQFTFTEEPLENTYNIKNFRLSYFYKGLDKKKRVPLGVGSMALWTTVLQYMSNIEEVTQKTYQSVPFDIMKLRYIGTEDESSGVDSISSTKELPYRLTHTFLTEENALVLYIEDCYNSSKKVSCLYNQGAVKLNYLEEDRLTKKVQWGKSIESELSKKLKQEQEYYLLAVKEYDEDSSADRLYN